MVLPEGLTLPPILHLVALVVAASLVGVGLVRADPRITAETVLGFVPWMAFGGALHVYAIEAIAAAPLVPFLEAPAVYVATFVMAGLTWLVAKLVQLDVDAPGPVAVVLAAIGGIALGLAVVGILWTAVRRGTFLWGWPVAGLAVSIVLTGLLWLGLRQTGPELTRTTGWVGVAVLFAHVLDGVSTAIGVDVLGAGERSPLPLFIMDLAARLPVAELVGVGWAFVLVKILVVLAILWLFVDFVKEAPRQAYLLLGAIVAVGLGPATHNLLLFVMAG